MTNELIIHTDGGARGNPGPAAIGVVIEKDGKVIHTFGQRIGESTNNVAEYTAVIEALKYMQAYRTNKKNSHSCESRDLTKNDKVPVCVSLGRNDKVMDCQTIHFVLDSLLVVNQLLGKFKVKDAKLRFLLLEVRSLEQEVGGAITYSVVPREQNRKADFLVNQALDQ